MIQLKNVAETTKYFTNGGFQKILMKKDIYKKDKFDLYSEAYRNDLENAEFKTLFYVRIIMNLPNFNATFLPNRWKMSNFVE